VAAAPARILITSMLLFSLANNWYATVYYYLALATSVLTLCRNKASAHVSLRASTWACPSQEPSPVSRT